MARVAAVDDKGQLYGTPQKQVRTHAKEAVERSRLGPGTKHISPVTYYWADWYKETGSEWKKILTPGTALGFVILNISSGSGGTKQDDWAEQARRAKNSGAQVLGYVRTTFGKRPKVEVLQEIQEHIDWYGVDGVFLDEAVNGWSDEQKPFIPYYQDLYDILKDKYGSEFWVVNNPGSNTVEEMIPTADVLMTYEQSAENYLHNQFAITPGFYLKYPSSKFWHVVHDVTPENYRQVMEKADREHCAHIYLTDLSFVPSDDPQTPTVNPYATAPSDWLLDLQAAWARGGLLPYAKALDVQERIGAGEWVPAADVIAGTVDGMVFVQKTA
ncbi:spherulation-specific family 4 protein [uncultured Rothia sp.]|uniref:spherulation-specific family 4 protein n=1 Tax=uncultured Rothia sp. TaxID=316088 RepID=UPI003216AE2C